MGDIKVPAVGESISEGVLVEWHVKDGAYVEVDTPLFDVETDKVTVTVEAEEAGAIKIGVAAGAEIEIGQSVGSIDASAAKPAGGSGGGEEKKASGGDSESSKPAESSQPKKEEPKPAPAASSEPKKESKPEPAKEESQPAAEGGNGGGNVASPTVRAMMRRHGLTDADVSGTGPAGRITVEDVQKAADAPAAPKSSGGSTASSAPARQADGPRQEREKMSQMRVRIAQRLVEAKNTTAMLTTFNEVDMTNAMALRKRYNEGFQKKYGVKIGFMSIFLKAAIDALKTVPKVNAYLDLENKEIVNNHFYDIGIAVSTEKGLVVPVLRDADQMGFAEIEQGIGDLAKRARDRKLEISELSGGVFSITNGGIFGSLLSTPILNPPQSAILGMHTIKKRPIVVDEGTPKERIEARPMMYLALSYDHRIIDGSEAVTFLKRICDCVADPERMLFQI